jgi:DNA mismatch repair protein MutL
LTPLLVRPEIIEQQTKKPSPPEEPSQTAQKPSPEKQIDTETTSASPWGWCRILGQIGGNYVVLETEDGFVLMEPRAAHERVLFERFMSAIQNRALGKQGLLIPETIELLPADAEIVRTHLDALNELGFSIHEFGADTFLVDALPAPVADQAAEPLLIEIAHALETSGKKRANRELIFERIAQVACQMAVRRKERLSDKEIEQLVRDLAQTKMPYTSPRGRPTLVYTSFSELHRKFNRP